uniref:General transcription factor IIF subunit 2 n=1 Tax=Sinocyclocheilus rhinocerous TaxID=307959 RepID=A0A673IFT7_9TELE
MSDKGQDVDLTRAKQNTGVWLVKVPKYLSQQWAKASGLLLMQTEELTVVECSGEKVSSVRSPRGHPFTIQTVGGQALAVFTETSESESSNKLALEGMVVQRAECKMCFIYRLQIEESTKPLRFSQKLEKAITTNYKPVSNHSHNLEYEKRKKEEGKRARADKQKVLEMLFSAFEKHQYYNIRDLVDITKQPVVSCPVLREIGVYNSRGPHKSTWELKPEYRHYEKGQEEKMK